MTADVYLSDLSQAERASPMLNIADPRPTLVVAGSSENESVEPSKEFDTVLTMRDREGRLVKEMNAFIESGSIGTS
jgi:hypothetical protein